MKKSKMLSGSSLMIIGSVLVVVLLLIVTVASNGSSEEGSQNSLTNQDDLLTIQDDDYVVGPNDASVTLIEYLDFECEACGAYFPVVKQLEEEFYEELRVVKRYYPLPGHKNGLLAALAVEAAARQGKYNEMHDLLFLEQGIWGERPTADPAIFEEYAERLGLDLDQFKEDASSQSAMDRVQRDVESGDALGNTGTPSFYLNGEKIQNPRSYEDFATLVEAAIITSPKPGELILGAKVHEHADFAVYLDGEKFDFSQSQYQSSDENPLDADTHLHDGNGSVVHKHREGITLGYFFETIGMQFDDQCFETDDGAKSCTYSDSPLKMYINGELNDTYGSYEFSDLDQILITNANDTDVTAQIESLTDDACLYSEICPERGTPPTETCVGGLGSDC